MDRATSYGKTIDNRFAKRDERAHRMARERDRDLRFPCANREGLRRGRYAYPFRLVHRKKPTLVSEKNAREKGRASVIKICVFLAQIEKVYESKEGSSE